MAEPPPRIQRLPDALINRIAAGEVVERPASVLKELLENSLDAGAATLTVQVEGAGIRLLRVRDDGTGMGQADVALAVERHATSKITDGSDLDCIRSLGFRGEALASIGAVAELTLTSAVAQARGGWVVRVLPGQRPQAPAPAAHPVGTTVEVRDLFATVPARRRFLRTERTEAFHLLEVVRRLALCRFDVGIRYQHDGRQVLGLRAATAEAEQWQRLARVCGRVFADEALAVAASAAGMRLTGWVLSGSRARNQSDLQYLALNGRPIRDLHLQRAIRRAYGERLPGGRHPAWVLALALEPAQFDVNVHPAKSEVRFRDLRSVHDFVLCAVRDALDAGARPAAAAAYRAPDPARAGTRVPMAAEDGGPVPPQPQQRAPESPYAAPPAPAPAGASTDPRAVALIECRFLLVCQAGGVHVLDALVAWTRALSARLCAGAAAGALDARPLLVPANVELERRSPPAERALGHLAPFGFELDALGPSAVSLRAVPAVLERVDAQTLVPELLAEAARWPAAGPSEPQAAALIERVAAHGARVRLAAHADAQAVLRAVAAALAAAGLEPGPWTRVLDGTALAGWFEAPP